MTDVAEIPHRKSPERTVHV